jgi:hypothetical protein
MTATRINMGTLELGSIISMTKGCGASPKSDIIAYFSLDDN